MAFKKGHPSYLIKHTEEAKEKIRKNNAKYWLGKKRPDISERIRIAMLGNSKGMGNVGNKHTEEWKQKMRQRMLGSRNPFYGKRHPPEIMERISGVNHVFWKGGVTSINRKLRKSREFKEWRTKVFEFDNYTCWICETRGSIKLHPHHLKRFSDYPELRFNISNGLTLCEFCHRTYTKFGVKAL